MNSELLLILVGALFASLSSFALFYLWENMKTRQKIKNTQKIINDEFYMMRSYAQSCNDTILELMKNQEGSMSQLIENIFYDIPRGHEPTINLVFQQPFMFWNSIASSGSLINLPSRDIVLVNDFYKRVEFIFKFNKEDYESLKSHLKDAVLSGNETVVKMRCHMYMGQVYPRFWRLIDHFDRLCKSMDWMKAQYSSPDLEKLIAEYSGSGGDLLIQFPIPEDDEVFERKTPI